MAILTSNSVASIAYKVTRTVTGVQCDVCDAIIPVKPSCYGDNSNQYFEVTTGHRDWGNDSCESVETRDICRECVVDFIKKYLSDCSNTAYLNLQTRVVYGREISEVVDKPPKNGEITKIKHDCY